MKTHIKKAIEERKNTLLAFIKQGARVALIEREIALLAFDIVLALPTEKLAKVGSRYFREIDFALTGTMRKKLSEETRELINEMLVLDELGETHGPNLTLAFDMAQKIVGGQGSRMVANIKSSQLTAA